MFVVLATGILAGFGDSLLNAQHETVGARSGGLMESAFSKLSPNQTIDQH
jgi:hypothetical protein